MGVLQFRSSIDILQTKCGQIYQYLIVLKPFWVSNPLNMGGAFVREEAFIRINTVIASEVDETTLKLLMMVKVKLNM